MQYGNLTLKQQLQYYFTRMPSCLIATHQTPSPPFDTERMDVIAHWRRDAAAYRPSAAAAAASKPRQSAIATTTANTTSAGTGTSANHKGARVNHVATSTNQMESGLALSVSRLYDAVEAANDNNNAAASPGGGRHNSNASGSLRPNPRGGMHHSSLPSIETGMAVSNARFNNNNNNDS